MRNLQRTLSVTSGDWRVNSRSLSKFRNHQRLTGGQLQLRRSDADPCFPLVTADTQKSRFPWHRRAEGAPLQSVVELAVWPRSGAGSLILGIDASQFQNSNSCVCNNSDFSYSQTLAAKVGSHAKTPAHRDALG